MASFPRPSSSLWHIPTPPAVMQTSWLSFVMWEYSAPWISGFLWLTSYGIFSAIVFSEVSFPVSLCCSYTCARLPFVFTVSCNICLHIFLSSFWFLGIFFPDLLMIFSWLFWLFSSVVTLTLLSFLFKSYISRICDFFSNSLFCWSGLSLKRFIFSYFFNIFKYMYKTEPVVDMQMLSSEWVDDTFSLTVL